MKNEVQLITYVDRLGGTLPGLHALLAGPLAGLFGGVHLLPFFHPIDGADAGFDPIDHTQVDPRLGDWRDVQALARTHDVMADVIVNHVSSGSPQFLDWSAHGSASPHAGMFLTFDTVFPRGATERELLAIYRPRPGLPFTPVTLANGARHVLWTSFTPQQLDIDVEHPQGRAYLDGILQSFAAYGIRMIRLDAAGYAIKRAGSSCFMTPDTFAFIDAFAARARGLGIEVLVEIHSHHLKQIEIARRVDWVYDFALPPLALHAHFFRTARYLKAWIAMRPRNALTVLDTHDGIGIIDIGAERAEHSADDIARPGLVPPAELDQLVEHIHGASHGQSRQATGVAASNLDLYQVNCSFYDAMGRDDRAYLAARALQCFLPGVPQIYYVGLLAGGNDMALLERSGIGRDINRHHYTPGEIGQQLERLVVRRLFALIALRNTHPAFGGAFTLQESDVHRLALRWEHGAEWATLLIDYASGEATLQYSHAGATGQLPLDG